MASFRCRFSLGSERLVKGMEWRGAMGLYKRIKKRQIDEKGINLTLMRWKNWVNQLEFAEEALHEKKSYGNHIGGKKRGCVYKTVLET